jgi:hypothetical protein
VFIAEVHFEGSNFRLDASASTSLGQDQLTEIWRFIKRCTEEVQEMTSGTLPAHKCDLYAHAILPLLRNFFKYIHEHDEFDVIVPHSDTVVRHGAIWDEQHVNEDDQRGEKKTKEGPEETPTLTFPGSLGPFGLQPTQGLIFKPLSSANSREYTVDLVKTNQKSEALEGWTLTTSGYTSGWAAVTVPEEIFDELLIPPGSKSFSWLYPVHDISRLSDENKVYAAERSPEFGLLVWGGFQYKDEDGNIVGTNAFQSYEDGTNVLRFKAPLKLDDHAESRKAHSFVDVTVDDLQDKGARSFAWIHPGLEIGGQQSGIGGFAYLFGEIDSPSSRDCFFPLLTSKRRVVSPDEIITATRRSDSTHSSMRSRLWSRESSETKKRKSVSFGKKRNSTSGSPDGHHVRKLSTVAGFTSLFHKHKSSSNLRLGTVLEPEDETKDSGGQDETKDSEGQQVSVQPSSMDTSVQEQLLRVNVQDVQGGSTHNMQDGEKNTANVATFGSPTGRRADQLPQATRKLREEWAEIYTRLRKLPLLRNLTEGEIRALAKEFKQLELPAGSYVMKQGEKIHDDSKFYFLDHGSVRIIVDGMEVVTREKGSYFGEKGLIENQPRSADIVAISKIVCLCIRRVDFEKVSNYRFFCFKVSRLNYLNHTTELPFLPTMLLAFSLYLAKQKPANPQSLRLSYQIYQRD